MLFRSNAFLGINHSLAHKIGGEFGLPHGLAIAIAMPHVIKFNAVTGNVKRTPYPRYETYRAQEDYAEISRFMGFAGKEDSDEKAVKALVAELKKLTDSIDINITLSGNGVDKAHLERELDKLADLVYDDQCTPANPRQPRIDEIKQLLLDQY